MQCHCVRPSLGKEESDELETYRREPAGSTPVGVGCCETYATCSQAALLGPEGVNVGGGVVGTACRLVSREPPFGRENSIPEAVGNLDLDYCIFGQSGLRSCGWLSLSEELGVSLVQDSSWRAVSVETLEEERMKRCGGNPGGKLFGCSEQPCAIATLGSREVEPASAVEAIRNKNGGRDCGNRPMVSRRDSTEPRMVHRDRGGIGPAVQARSDFGVQAYPERLTPSSQASCGATA